jgi:TldD protein
MLTRREFLASSAAFATSLFGAPGGSKTPSADLEKLGAAALRESKKYKATYCDIRIVRLREQRIGLRLSPQRGAGKTLAVPNLMEDSSFGFGVRVIVDGAWGFAASPVVTPEEIANITKEAVIVAKANAAIQPKPIQLAPVKAYRDRWATPFDKDPFDVPMGEKLDLLRCVTEQVKKNPKVFSGAANLSLRSEDKYFASTEGSSIQQYILQIYGNVDANAIDRKNNVSRSRSYVPTTGFGRVGVCARDESRRKCPAASRRGRRASDSASRDSRQEGLDPDAESFNAEDSRERCAPHRTRSRAWI